MKILVFGGSFDPPHKGHAALLAAAVRRVKPDRVLIVPAFHAPLKDEPAAPASARVELARAGLLNAVPRPWRRRAALDLSEARAGRPVFTIETVRRLRRLHPEAELHFVVGSDSAASFDRWREHELLAELCVWWTAARPGAGEIPSAFNRLREPMPDISSTELRSRLALGQDVEGSMAQEVLAVIERRGLYGTALLRELKSMLKPSRLEHTLAVARLASDLARRWGQSERRARLAGLLHDCGRSVPIERMAAEARTRRLNVPLLSETARRHPLLLHAYLSEDIARRRFGVSDPEVLSAVRKHTLGAPTMTPLDRLMYVADACSADRDYPGVEGFRRLAYQDLDEAFRACVSSKLGHALSSGGWLHPVTVELWNSLAST